MFVSAGKKLEKAPIEASAPCRIDFGGTLDIPAMHYPLRHIRPCTFNVALDMRTRVRLSAFTPGKIKVSSKGFEDAEFPSDALPFNHHMGLVFAIAAYFSLDGVHIEIFSESPPRSALGGSSVAAVAVIGAVEYLFSDLAGEKHVHDDSFRHAICLTGHAIESGVAGVPCGYQDQLGAAFGGACLWTWTGIPSGCPYTRQAVSVNPGINNNILVAYCGKPHVSADINSEWMRRFINGERKPWIEISSLTRHFAAAFEAGEWKDAAGIMTRETDIRLAITPDVLDETGKKLYESAKRCGCSARFAGAGGGGCVWGIGDAAGMADVRKEWAEILEFSEGGEILDAGIDSCGFRIDA